MTRRVKFDAHVVDVSGVVSEGGVSQQVAVDDHAAVHEERRGKRMNH